MANVAYRPQVAFSETDSTEKDVQQAVADHERFRFANLTITNATNAQNFAAGKYLALVNNKGVTIGYIPVHTNTANVW